MAAEQAMEMMARHQAEMREQMTKMQTEMRDMAKQLAEVHACTVRTVTISATTTSHTGGATPMSAVGAVGAVSAGDAVGAGGAGSAGESKSAYEPDEHTATTAFGYSSGLSVHAQARATTGGLPSLKPVKLPNAMGSAKPRGPRTPMRRWAAASF